MKDKQSEVAIAYLQNLAAEQRCEKDNWALLSNNIKDIQSKPIQTVIKNQALFNEKIGKEEVEKKLKKSKKKTIVQDIDKYKGWNENEITITKVFNRFCLNLPRKFTLCIITTSIRKTLTN